MKLLLVNHLLDPISGGGTAERTYQLARFLALNGVECTILTLDIGLIKERLASFAPVRVYSLPTLNKRFFVPVLRIKQILDLVTAADVVHLSGHWTVLNVLVFLACLLRKRPYLFCPAGAFMPVGRSIWIKRVYNRIVGRAMMRHAGCSVAITSDEAAEFISRGMSPERVAVIPNGIDLSLYAGAELPASVEGFRSRYGLDSAPFVLYLGRLNTVKGPDLLLEAFAEIASQYQNFLLVLAGPDDGMGLVLRQRAQEMGLQERVRFLGFLSGSSKVQALQAASLMVIPSRHEAMSIVVLEAGACACPVVFTETCGLSEFAEQGAGYMVAPSASDIAKGIREALANPEERSARGMKLFEVVGTDYLWETQAHRLHELIKQVLGR